MKRSFDIFIEFQQNFNYIQYCVILERISYEALNIMLLYANIDVSLQAIPYVIKIGYFIVLQNIACKLRSAVSKSFRLKAAI